MNAITDERGLIIPCASCGQKNRIPYERLGTSGRCGRCGADIPPPAVPLEIETEAQFHRLVDASPLPVLVDFWAPWCGPCRMVAPELQKVAASQQGRALVVKVNTEAVPALAERYGIYSIPTMAVFVEGRETARVAGARPASAIESFLRQSVSASRAA